MGTPVPPVNSVKARKSKPFHFFFSLGILWGCLPAQGAITTSLPLTAEASVLNINACGTLVPQSHQVIFASSDEVHQRFDLVIEDPETLPVLSISEMLPTFKDWVSSFSSLNADTILAQQAESIKNWPGTGDEQTWRSHALARISGIRSGDIGSIQDTDCLVQTLFAYQELAFPQHVYPGEMLAYLLKSTTSPTRYRVYFSYGRGSVFDASPPINPILWEQMIRDVWQHNWSFYAHLHSHPFMIAYTPAPHIGGLLLPSDEDIQAYQDLATVFPVPRMWITNGFQALKLTAADLQILQKTIPSHPAYQGADQSAESTTPP